MTEGETSLVQEKKDKDCCISNEDMRILKRNSKLTLCKSQIKKYCCVHVGFKKLA